MPRTCKNCNNILYGVKFGQNLSETLEKPYGNIHHITFQGVCFIHNINTNKIEKYKNGVKYT